MIVLVGTFQGKLLMPIRIITTTMKRQVLNRMSVFFSIYNEAKMLDLVASLVLNISLYFYVSPYTKLFSDLYLSIFEHN